MFPRLSLTFSPNNPNCTPFRNCTERNRLTSVIESLSFTDSNDDTEIEEDMTCALASNPKYALLCGDRYQDLLSLEDCEPCEVQTRTAQCEIMALFVFAFITTAIIICLVLNTIRLTRRLNGHERMIKEPNLFKFKRFESKCDENQNEI